MCNNYINITTIVNTRIEEVVLTNVPIRQIGVETYPTSCIEVEGKRPRLITEICSVCGIDDGAKRIVYIKLLRHLIKLDVLT